MFCIAEVKGDNAEELETFNEQKHGRFYDFRMGTSGGGHNFKWGHIHVRDTV